MTYQCPREEVNCERVRIREELREWLPFPEGQRTDVIARSPRCDRVELVKGGRAQDVEDESELVVVVAAGEERLAGEHLSEDAANRPDVDCLETKQV